MTGFEMFAPNSIIVLFFMFFYVSDCQRRITDGLEVSADRKYMVYLVKAPMSEKGYDSWLCGGAIVNERFVITSAACVNDVEYIYVIAGYKKYITDSDIENNPCTAAMKKKVIYTCSPKGYELKYGELDYWSYIDIALVRIESPFDFNDPMYETLCSYKPTWISINYDERYQEPGIDALVLGWGHTGFWRKPGDPNNYNNIFLRYAPTLLLNKTSCIEHYEDYKNMSIVIKNYMICSLGKGNIDDTGKTIIQSPPIHNGCTSKQEKILGFEGLSCEDKSTEDSSSDEDQTRRHNERSNQTNNVTSKDFNETRARRSGICQNDHGGPLVTWVGAREILIGVASVFKVSDEYQCMGPYLYTSTTCTGLFLDCILNSEFPNKRSGRRYLCDRPASERGYDIIERTISWKDHPAGPAENENIGRNGHEAKLSAGLKYLTNNNQPPQPGYSENKMNAENAKNQEETKYESNNMYLANNNPTLVSDAPKERFEVMERFPINKSISGVEGFPVNDKQQERTKYESSEMYLANKNPAIVSDAHKESFLVQYRYPENRSIPGKQIYPVNDRHPVSQTGRHQEEINKKYVANIRNPGNETNPAHQGYPSNQKYPANGRYPPASMGPPKNPQKVPAKVSVRLQRPLRN